MDTIHFKVRKDSTVISKAAYAANGVNLEGKKDLLISSIDGLIGFNEAIRAVYPNTEIQKCIIHQIRNSSKCLFCKDFKIFNAYFKLVYIASTEEVALAELDRLKEKWREKYLIAVKS